MLSLFAHWHSPNRKEIEGRVEAGDNEWLWYAPLGGGRSVAAVFIDPKRLSGTAPANLECAYYDLLLQFRLFRPDQAGRVDGKVTACDATARYAEQAAGLDFVRVGDANLTLDPLSSQGIQSAIASGIQAAAVINTLAKRPANTTDAITFYRERQIERITQHATKAAAFYRERAAVCDRPFWRRRASANVPVIPVSPALETKKLESTCRLELSMLTSIECTPILQGDMISSNLAIRTEALDRPVAFLADVELVPLLRQIRSGQSASSIVDAWSDHLSANLCWDILYWLWQRRIVVPVANSSPSRL